ncbi:multidrug effflux MFS transporter [Psychromonas ossibalaenae]|uniref:multidrug effflux MFS transporter n=1 Tax=Psychromonas ossibalaenae TaxID=444922 RepID=UPI0003678B2A|nr:multidrug effflux MFS transporter [Psychromonas ossibalaenae]
MTTQSITDEITIKTTNQADNALQSKTISKTLILTLATVFAISPFAIDTYLPAMPNMAEAMQVDISMVSVTVSLYILGMALGQLIGGPLSDQKGRRFVMMLGLLIFAVGSVLLTTSTSIEILWLWRFIQAAGGGMAVVGVPAIIRDVSSGKESAKLFSLIALIMMIAPSIAPTVGTLILSMSSWQWIFYFLAVIAVVVIGLVMVFIPARSPQVKNITSTAKSFSKDSGLRSVFRQKNALGFMFAQAFAYSVMMTFLTNASMIYMKIFGVSAAHFSMLFIANICGLVIINRLNTLLLRWYEPATLLKCFLLLQVSGGLILTASVFIAPDLLYFAVIGFVVSIAANGGIMANASACFLKYYAHNAGSASAVLGAMQYTVGAAISAFAAVISMGNLLPVVLVMLLSSTVALASAVSADKKSRTE